jgi:hypothetical protein
MPLSDMIHPNCALAITLIHGASVFAEELVWITYSRPFLENPPMPLKN